MIKFKNTKREEVKNSNFMSLAEAKAAKEERKEKELQEKLKQVLSYEESVEAIQHAIKSYVNNSEDFYNFEFLYKNNGKDLENVYSLDPQAQKEAEEKGYKFEQGITGLKIIFG